MKGYPVIIALLLFLAAGLDARAAENATITGDALRIREKPTTDAAVVGTLNKGARIEVLAHTDATDSIDGFTGYWYYIIYKGTYGYVFGKYVKSDTRMSIPSESDYRATAPSPAALSDILGDWPMYYDAPNITFSFYPDMTAKFIESTFVGGGEKVVTYPPVFGTYIFDGKTITAQWNDGSTGVFVVEKKYGVTALYLNGVILPPELHMTGPGGYHGID